MSGSWLLAPALLALAGYGVAALPLERMERIAGSLLLAAWLAHALTIVVDVGSLGQPDAGARFGFAPALAATLWLVVGVYIVESRWVPISRLRRSIAMAGALTIALLLAFPGEPFAQHAPWAPVHWLTGIASYGLFAVAVMHAGLLAKADRRMRQPRPAGPASTAVPLLRLERLTFQFVRAGFIALSATLVLGWMFSPQWRWDHKTVFSVLAWLVFAALLIGREVFGWRGRMATRWVYTGAGLLLLAYVGSRFVLEVLLDRPVLG